MNIYRLQTEEVPKFLEVNRGNAFAEEMQGSTAQGRARGHKQTAKPRFHARENFPGGFSLPELPVRRAGERRLADQPRAVSRSSFPGNDQRKLTDPNAALAGSVRGSGSEIGNNNSPRSFLVNFRCPSWKRFIKPDRRLVSRVAFVVSSIIFGLIKSGERVSRGRRRIGDRRGECRGVEGYSGRLSESNDFRLTCR